MREAHADLTGTVVIPPGCGQKGSGLPPRRLELQVAEVITVHMAEQHEVDGAQPRIVAAGHIVRGVVEEPHAGRILEDDCAIVRAQLTGVGADRRDLHVLGQDRECGERKGDC